MRGFELAAQRLLGVVQPRANGAQADAGHDQQDLRHEIIAQMAAFCGRWARSCGIALADEGEPAAIGDHFWYDDGLHQWPQVEASKNKTNPGKRIAK